MIGLLGERGVETEARATTGPDDAAPLAHEAAAAGAEIIIAYGGDGTLNEVIQGMAESEAALAVWPGGTANVVARDLGVPFATDELADMIAGGKIQRIALGLARTSPGFRVKSSGFRVQGSEFSVQASGLGVRGSGFSVQSSGFDAHNSPNETVRANSEPGTPNPEPGTLDPERGTPNPEPGTLDPERGTPNPDLGTVDPEPRTEGRYFVMMAGIGLDASIARGVNKKLKRRTGEVAYWLSGLKHLFLWRGEPFTIEVDGACYESTFALVGNGKGYGGGMMMTPGARLEEPWFEVYILSPPRNNFGYLSALRGCMRGKPEIGGGLLVKGKHVRANSAHEPWVEADGEIIGPLPMTFDVVSDALSIIVP